MNGNLTLICTDGSRARLLPPAPGLRVGICQMEQAPHCMKAVNTEPEAPSTQEAVGPPASPDSTSSRCRMRWSIYQEREGGPASDAGFIASWPRSRGGGGAASPLCAFVVSPPCRREGGTAIRALRPLGTLLVQRGLPARCPELKMQPWGHPVGSGAHSFQRARKG